MPDDVRPFSLYDDEEPEGGKPEPPPAGGGEGLDLEIEEKPGEEDAQLREQLLGQLGFGGPKASPEEAPGRAPSEIEKAAPFLHGRADRDVTERSREIIRDRREKGAIRDRRRTASIFDKPIEPERAVRAAKASWHPLSYRWRAFWFVCPALVFFLLFYLYPTVEGFRISLTDFRPLGGSEPVGFANYERALQDDLFWQTVVNAAAFTLLSLVLGAWPPLILAVILNEVGRGRGVFRFLFLLPFVIPVVPAANLWKWMYDQGFGVWNTLLGMLPGASNPHFGFLTDPKWALLSIVVMFVWKNFGWFLLIYYASLQNLPEELYEAAELDGAGVFQKFLNVTLPHLWPLFSVLVVIQVLVTFQVFTEVHVMTGGGPMRSTEVLGTYIYKTAFGGMDLGYASAMAMLMFVALAFFSAVRMVQLRNAQR